MKKRKTDDWFPFWIDKWLFGSTRIELEPDERGVFVDLMSLSKKDDGWIRANEGVPYLTSQLCGMLNVKEELFLRTVDKCLKFKKIKKYKNGTFYMTSHEGYKLSSRHKRRLAGHDVPESGHDGQESGRLYKNKEDIKKEDIDIKDIEAEFEEFWKAYRSIGNPKDDIGRKEEAFKAYKTLRKTVELKTIAKALHGYGDFLKHKKLKENFPQRKKYGSTWLRSERWKEYLEFKYEPDL